MKKNVIFLRVIVFFFYIQNHKSCIGKPSMELTDVRKNVRKRDVSSEKTSRSHSKKRKKLHDFSQKCEEFFSRRRAEKKAQKSSQEDDDLHSKNDPLKEKKLR